MPTPGSDPIIIEFPPWVLIRLKLLGGGTKETLERRLMGLDTELGITTELRRDIRPPSCTPCSRIKITYLET